MLAANYPPPVLPIRGRGAVPGASVHRLSMENDLAQSVAMISPATCCWGAPLASYGLVVHFPSCSPVVVVVVVAHVFEQRLTRLAYVLVRVCLRVSCLSVCFPELLRSSRRGRGA